MLPIFRVVKQKLSAIGKTRTGLKRSFRVRQSIKVILKKYLKKRNFSFKDSFHNKLLVIDLFHRLS